MRVKFRAKVSIEADFDVEAGAYLQENLTKEQVREAELKNMEEILLEEYFEFSCITQKHATYEVTNIQFVEE